MASLLFFEEKMGFQLKRQLLTLRNYLNASFYSLFSKKLPENKQKKEVVLFFFFDFNLHQFEEEKIIFLFFFLSKKLALFALKTLKKKNNEVVWQRKKMPISTNSSLQSLSVFALFFTSNRCGSFSWHLTSCPQLALASTPPWRLEQLKKNFCWLDSVSLFEFFSASKGNFF